MSEANLIERPVMQSTPGPWRRERGTTYFGIYATSGKGLKRRGRLIAAVYLQGENPEADARLIENAPEIRRVGAQLRNVAFNLAQRVGQPLSTHDAEILDRLRREWDAAMRAA